MRIAKLLTACALVTSITLGFSYNSIADSAPLPIVANQCSSFIEPGNPGHADLYLCRDGYINGYDYKTKQPAWVAYKLTGKSVGVSIKRKDRFAADTAVPKQYRSELSDYRKSGYDRGHLAPYAAMDFSQESANQSFYLSNMSPQKGGLNRQGWAQLEKYVRFWAKYKGEIFVYTGPIYKKQKIHKTIGKSKVAVPDYYFKIVYAPKQKEAIAFVMPNKKVKRKDVAKYRVSIKDIEQRTGLQFLTNLPENERLRLVDGVSKMWRTHYGK
jgi:endonuclease G